MIFKKMLKNLITINFLFFFIFTPSSSSNVDAEFKLWVNAFKKQAVNSGVSKRTVEDVISEARYLPKVIEYDRYQPEFYEDTLTYIKKRSSKNKIRQGLKLYKKEKRIIEKIESEFKVEKELLLALMGIETNFGN